MKRYFSQSIIGIFVIFALFGCNSVSPDPKEGADQLIIKLTKCVKAYDKNKANQVLLDYWNSYNDEQRKVFLLTLRDELMTNEKVVRFIAKSDFHEYPMFGLYMKHLNNVAYDEAKLNLDIITNPSESSYKSTAALKAILMGLSLADCFDRDDSDYGNEIINTACQNLNKASLLYRIEFAGAFKTFIDESGELGIKAYEYLTNRFDRPIKYTFYRLLLESKVDLDLNSLSDIDEDGTASGARIKNLPTKEEIQSVNANLPVKVAEGTMCTKIEYDEQKMIQTFYYDFTYEVDERMARPEIIDNLKSKMVNALKGTDNEERIRDGVTFIFVYRSINKKVLYKIIIDSSDFE